MQERRMQFAIGLVTLIATFALGAIIIWFGEFQFILTPRKIYYITFTYAQGAAPQIPVRRAGIRIGEVKAVEYSEQFAQVIVTVIIEGKNYLRQGDIPTLKTSNLFGDTYLDIETSEEMRGKLDRPIIPPQSTLEGKDPIEVAQTLERASELMPTVRGSLDRFGEFSDTWTRVGNRADRIMALNEDRIATIMEETQNSIERLTTTLDTINNILDEKSQQNLKVTLENIRRTSDELEPVVKASRETIEQIGKTTAKLDEVAGNLQVATKPLAERSENTFRNLEEVTESLNLLLVDLRDLSSRVRSEDGTFQRLMRDPSLYDNLDIGSSLLVKNLEQLDKIMQDLRVFSDKIARHPGELGVQGVITRDSGLKTAEPGTLGPSKGLFGR